MSITEECKTISIYFNATEVKLKINIVLNEIKYSTFVEK